jgi:hypothetical protein
MYLRFHQNPAPTKFREQQNQEFQRIFNQRKDFPMIFYREQSQNQ